ncbi:MAG: hypothetical protein J1G38_05050 [Clostridiales bacterium]|nr:hypothetical protein [Clostridiales bacterium]
MIIGLVVLGCVVVLLFFGITQRVLNSFGVAYWLAFIVIGALIASAFVPSFAIYGVSVSVSGFIVPSAVAVLFFAISGRAREAGHSAVTASAVLAVYVAVELLLAPVVNATVIAVVAGISCGAIAYVVGKTELVSVAGVFTGVVTGDVVAAVVEHFSYGSAMRLGSYGSFDAIVLGAVFSVILFEAVAAVKRRLNAKRSVMAETAEEFDPDEYKKYFDE